ncbi:3-hydroxyacyl-CoA dehydrogenase NAD-binding domain-containing protein [Brevibacillus fulvus]|uniref:3-hydroxybutyryl-CoA dehydrogenase n=1 Tax=Brevibacillus fulvus TaxID=1125967 RepID=A0A938Y086_9BACL|nr:3-hydroxyacyl-CoA dehydrogenase NAD-binding domain-containing protein [Brevibacillus fulvus]MBM7589167.1 3-hydroxybutyryl-CoA dehydrogenase [Brevibacillus fulvus]
MKLKTIGVVGAGTMGAGIAQIIAQSGFAVIVYDLNESAVNRGIGQIAARWAKQVQQGKWTEQDVWAFEQRLTPTTDLQAFSDCHLVIEAVPEVLSIKEATFRRLAEICPAETLLVTNTSSFSVTEIASCTMRPERVAGLHFFNPAPVMPLVEIVKGLQTAKETVVCLEQFAAAIGKEPVVCQDTPGFVVNRIARPYYNEAVRIWGDQVADVAQIDRIMKKAGAFRMGPFELQDLIGIDINFSTTTSVHQGFFADARFRPHYLQQRMVQSGQIGRKAGGGYYRYEDKN